MNIDSNSSPMERLNQNPVKKFEQEYELQDLGISPRRSHAEAVAENVEEAFFEVVMPDHELVRPDYDPIGKGAVKIVWIDRNQLKAADQKKLYCYYTPVDSFRNANERELREEFNTMNLIYERVMTIQEALKKEGSECHLAVEAEELAEGIQGQYTLKVELASERHGIDLENRIRDPEVEFDERISLGQDLLSGLFYLHGANFVHGDLKPANCNLYFIDGKLIMRISDFGKAKELLRGPKEEFPYKGNTRFAPPEGKLSQASDVYGAAIVLIRIFEESLLKGNETSLLMVGKEEWDMPADPSLRGIEKYIVENIAFSAANPTENLSNLEKASPWRLTRRFFIDRRSDLQQSEQTQQLHLYISELTKRLTREEKISPEQAGKLENLLKRMTSTVPERRLSAEQAGEFYKQIFYPDS